MHAVGSESNKFGGDMHGTGCHTNMKATCLETMRIKLKAILTCCEAICMGFEAMLCGYMDFIIGHRNTLECFNKMIFLV